MLPRLAPPYPRTDQSRPYYVHPSDDPSSVKVTLVLQGFNYHSWERSMCKDLGDKMKLKFVDEFLLVPVEQVQCACSFLVT